jgi:putative drug exporter of the RND superfamily
MVALLITAGAGVFIALAGPNTGADKPPLQLPSSAESARAAALSRTFPGGDEQPAMQVVSRRDGAPLSPGDMTAAQSARQRVQARGAVVGGPPLITSQDGRAAVAPVHVAAGLSGFALRDTIAALRTAATSGAPADLTVQLTGAPAFIADITDAMSHANITLLAVTATVVAVLLIVTYRSPILWLVPLAVIGLADGLSTSIGIVVSRLTGLPFDGATSGITSVLVFGAGTNYALLLISRYREELTRTEDHAFALRAAVRRAGPAIAASNATVVLALLILVFAVGPATRSLGVHAACGLVVAVVFVLVVLPPLLRLFGRRLFWPFTPRRADNAAATGIWHRVADWVTAHAARVAVSTTMLLALLGLGLIGTPIGLSQIDQFRVRAESVTGYETLAAHFPGGLTGPTLVIGATARAEGIRSAITTTPGVVPAGTAVSRAPGLTQWTVVLDAPPASATAFKTVAALRESVRTADPTALIGGSDAQALDSRDAAVRDRWVLMPAILAVVLVVLYVLLRAVLAPLVLVAAMLLSALSALGLGGWTSVHLLGMPALDHTTALFAFLFLVALGVDYTIFLVTRAREETPRHGTRAGMVRAVSATGPVITSAGIVMAAVFCVLAVLPLIVLTQLGVIVGLGILLDTFVVRTVLIPALFTVIGPRIWWPLKLDDTHG